METLLGQIKNLFYSGHHEGWTELPPVKAYAFKANGEFGVAIEYKSDNEISETFANCRLYTKKEHFKGDEKEYNFLKFSCEKELVMDQFASVCCQFLELGENDEERKKLLEDPVLWWKKWCLLMGDSISKQTPYSVIAEMAVYAYLLKQGKNVTWTASLWGTKDFETAEESFEVKSTIGRTTTEAKISSIRQLDDTKPLFLFYCRMEPSPKGKSINDMVEILANDFHISEDELEIQLAAVGYEKGRSKRNEKYIFNDKWLYTVDDNFPKLTKADFKGDDYPPGITDIKYSINLSNIPYEKWD